MLFFDSFALIEIIKGNKNYEKYVEEKCITTELNLMEVYYYLLREVNEEKAESYYDFYLPSCVPIHNATTKSAMKFKLKYKDRKLSYVDCIGYTLAITKGIKFLTGDEQFKDLDNLEFVK